MRRLSIAIGASVLFAGACANVLSLEDARVDPALQSESDGDGGDDGSGGGGATASQACTEYCDDVMAHCTATFAVYSTRDSCLAVCAQLPQGTPGDQTGNSVQCRKRAAELAPTEPSFYCPAAGPGGNSVCGTNCEGLCALASGVCSGDKAQWPDVDSCLADCATIPDLGTYSTDSSFDMYEGPHVECRLFHASSAAIADADVHCKHVGGGSPCVAQEGKGGGP